MSQPPPSREPFPPHNGPGSEKLDYGGGDGRSPFARGLEWSSRATTIAAEMALPALLGWWLDGVLGTRIVFLSLFAVLGLATGVWHLVRMTQ